MRPPVITPPGFSGQMPEPQTRFPRAHHPGAHAGIPVGAIIAFPGEILQQAGKETQAGINLHLHPWMICDGSSILIDEFYDLFTVIGKMYGGDDTHFNLPDYQGYFLRGVDLDKTRDKDKRDPPANPGVWDNGPGTTQKDALRDHTHDLSWGSGVMAGETGSEVIMSGKSQTGNIHPETGVNISSFETRAMNIAVNWLIKTR